MSSRLTSSKAAAPSAAPVILEGDDSSALRREALALAASWMAGAQRDKVLAGLHVDVSVLESGPGAAIKVDEIRAIRRDALLRPFDGEAKVYIIERAHQMNVHAQNALLRILEEPPPSARFALLVQNALLLLPTVRSRCTLRRLASRGEAGIPPEEAERAAAFVDVLDRPWERAVAALSWDRFSREAMKGTLHAVLACLRDRCVRDGARAVYTETIGTVTKLLPTLDQNASVGSICGVLALPAAEGGQNTRRR